MTLPVLIAENEGTSSASLVGSSELRCAGSSRADAIAALQCEVAQRIFTGELVNLEIQPLGVSGLAGRFQDDPDLLQTCDQIYRERDAERLP